MLFNSFVFVCFLSIVLPVYYILATRWQNRFLFVASYVFYGWWDWRFLLLLAFSTVLDFTLGILIENQTVLRRRKLLVVASIVINLGILGTFKYFNFFVDSAVWLLESMGVHANAPLIRVLLPVGVSFYTFQSLAYVIDVYRRTQPAVKNFLDYALFVSYFPQLVAGPIERARHMFPQYQSPRVVTREQFNSGARLILCGFVKKVVIADGLAAYVDPVFQYSVPYNSAALWIAMYSFAIQIYCDFSGYTDIARGVSRLLGIELMENFRQPYFSSDITDFWRRWHISLSSWLREYLYIPLGGNRHGVLNQYRNLIITMLLGGLWHGAAWTYVIWGGIHGLYLAAHKIFSSRRSSQDDYSPSTAVGKMFFIFKILMTFHLVCFAWVFFRSPDLSAAFNYLAGMASIVFGTSFEGAHLWNAAIALAVYGVMMLAIDLSGLWSRTVKPFSDLPWWLRGTAYGACLIAIAYVRGYNGEVFIYFQF